MRRGGFGTGLLLDSVESQTVGVTGLGTKVSEGDLIGRLVFQSFPIGVNQLDRKR